MSWLAPETVSHLREVTSWPDLPGDRFTVRRRIGRGGMGTVYAARDEQLGREVAIKVSNAAAHDSALEARLREEARILAALGHPGVVPVYDIGLLGDGRLFYVMRLVEGDTLERHVPRLEGEAAVLALFARIVETVSFAHAAGVVHRDLKPSNVMVGEFGQVLVLDWGVAKILDRPDVRPAEASSAGERNGTAAGTRIGTPGFMAPEQQQGRSGEVGPGADVYALGALLYWMLMGRAPSPEAEGASVARTLGRNINRRLKAMVATCLAPDPADRYATAAELLDDLIKYRNGQAVSVYRETLFDRLGRWFTNYRTFILLILAYLVMRAVVAFVQR